MYRYLTILLLWISGAVNAQVSIIQYPLQNLQLKPADMFRADVLNADNKSCQLYIVGTIVNSQNGQKLVSAKSKVIDVAPGSKQLSESTLFPEYTFFSSTVEQTGSLPYGNYTVCLKAFLVGGVEETASACEDVELMPLSPPMLLSPENQSTIPDEHPLLIWLPPMPVGKEKVQYNLKLAEILPNQTAYDAIQKNYAMLEQQKITGTTLQYPANAMKLEPEKKYAWKVVALTASGKPIGETEVWWFIYKPVSPTPPDTSTDGFTILKRELDADYARLVDKKLYFQYTERYIGDNLTYKILEESGTEITAKCETSLTKGMGDNRYVLDLNYCSSIRKNHFYILEVYTPKHVKYQLKFKY
jgi:hypothetical protein